MCSGSLFVVEYFYMYIVFHIVSFLVNTFIIINIVDVILMGWLRPRFSFRLQNKTFFVKPGEKTVSIEEKKDSSILHTFFEYQNGPECAGFSSAFVLRHIGIQALGTEVYKDVPYKLSGGEVFPKGISGYFKNCGIKMKACTGNLNALKNEVSRGKPVIVVVRSFVGKSYLHFACVTGYDEENIYIADSIKDWANEEGEYYNRKVPVKIFKKLWNTSMLKMPLYRNMFYIFG